MVHKFPPLPTVLILTVLIGVELFKNPWKQSLIYQKIFLNSNLPSLVFRPDENDGRCCTPGCWSYSKIKLQWKRALGVFQSVFLEQNLVVKELNWSGFTVHVCCWLRVSQYPSHLVHYIDLVICYEAVLSFSHYVECNRWILHWFT